MSTTLVDTAAWIALVNTRDELHERAKDVMIELRRNNVALVTTEFVLLEVANTFCASAWRGKAVKLIDGLRSQPNLKIIEADSSLLSEGWQLYCSRSDKNWSLTDCVSFAVMHEEQITRRLLPIIILNKQVLLNYF